MNNAYKFNDCNCTVPIIDGTPQVDFNNLDLECPKIWNLYKQGFTTNVFQLGSYLGKRYVKELQPENLLDAAALVSIIRPGTSQVKDENGVCLTQVYCDRKTGRKDVPDNPISKVKPDTYGIIIYQEEIMLIAQEIAGFSPVDSLKFMKTCAKKDAAALFAFEDQFIKGCLAGGKVTKEEADVIFENIKASSRYSFNKSHAVSYAVIGAQIGWLKSHLPYHYLCAFLRYCKDYPKPQDEIRMIAAESRRLQIPFRPPSINNLPYTDFFIKNKSIYFGLDSIKGCGAKSFEKIPDVDWESINWTEFLINYSNAFKKTQLINMIQTGCMDHMGESRMAMEYEYNFWRKPSLTGTEQNQIKKKYETEQYLTLVDALRELKTKTTARENNIKSIIIALEDPPISLKDSRDNIVENEKELLGVNISCNKLKKANIPSTINSTQDVVDGLYNDVIIVGEISEYREFKIKNGKFAGQFMSSFKIIDGDGECEAVCFPEQLKRFEAAMFDGNICMFDGKLSNRGGLILNDIYEI